MNTLWKDVAYAVRTLRRAPAFSLIAILTLAVGIGASTALFSVANAVLLRPLPYADPGRLVNVWGDLVTRQLKDFPFAPGDLPDLRDQGTAFEGFAGLNTFRGSIPGETGEPEQVRFGQATTNLFSLLGARIIHGRDFVEGDGVPPPAGVGVPGPAAAPAGPRQPALAIISHGFWQRRFGGDRSAVGRTIDLANGGRAQVIGILAPEFELLFAPRLSVERAPDIWRPLRVDWSTASRMNVFLRVIGRLKPGVTLAQAQAQADAISADLRRRFAIKQTAGLHLRLEPMHDDLVADVRPAIVTLMGAVFFVLLIACANVANLLLVRAFARSRELSVRAALGGSRWRLVRQLLAESLLIAGGGALVGLLLARLGISLLVALEPQNLPRLDEVAIDRTVLAFAAIAAILSSVVFGLAPAIRASRPDLMEVLRQSGSSGLGTVGRVFRNGVVIVEVALSFVLLIGAGLMFRSFAALQVAEPGFDPDHVLTFLVELQGPRFNEADPRAAFASQLLDRLRAVPGVRAASAVTPLPLDGGLANARWGTEEAQGDATKFRQADVHIVLPGYFEAMRTRLLAGRTFTQADNRAGQKLLVVDSLLAARAFPGQSAVGKRLFARITSPEPEWFEIIGVVAHQRPTSLSQDGREALFVADAYFGHGAASRWIVRTDGDPNEMAFQIRKTVAALEPLAVVTEVKPMRAYVDKAMAPTRFAMTLIGVFAAIALLLAAVGLYGVLSTAVRQRTAEIGVRVAFGASATSIARLVIGQGLRLSAAGVIGGLAVAWGTTRMMETMLVGVRPTDPATFAAITVIFGIVATLAAWLPAQRAARLDPMAALRDE
jgi:putative ABC transport system permease protein